jgi:hypothetical protein
MRLAAVLSLAVGALSSLATECTEQLEIDCAIDVERSVKFCAESAETAGSDIIADIKCVEYLLRDKNACWPCICAEARKKGWKVKGCPAN